MARPLRVEVAGGLYHVIVRGNERRDVFRGNADRVRYLNRLAFYRKKFGFRVLAYCLMDNHVHLAIETGKIPLSKIMAGLQSAYTQDFNRRHKRSGHLFQGRYKAFLIEKDRYALALLRYLHENPVKARVVRRAEDFAWSSDRAYRRGRGPEWLDVNRLLSLLGRGQAEAIREYRKLMRAESEESYEDIATWGQAVKGAQAFANRVLQEAGEPPVTPRGLTAERVARQVARLEGVDFGQMRGPSRDRELSRARLTAVWLAREVARIPVAQAARVFGRDTSTMINGLNKLEAEMERNRGLRQKLHRLRERLSESPIIP
jgi:REP element-mobilizing transposase RayT